LIPRVALLCDSPDEQWPSMDTVGLMLAGELAHEESIRVERIAPGIRAVTRNFTVNRLGLRFIDYPQWIVRNRRRFDLFHIVDHSYSQIAHALPPGRTVITCHDLDTFRCVLEPERDPRGFFFRAMTKRILDGFRGAAHVACDSGATRDELLRLNVLPAERMSVAPLGAHPSCSPEPDPAADAEAERLLGRMQAGTAELLHVGSTIARKRIDVLLRTLAELRRRDVAVRLVRVGGPLGEEQRALARELNLEPVLVELPFLSREVLSAVYRRSALVLQPSSGEGFGLPVAEAMACGTPVIASDLPVLREVGGEIASYCAVGNVPQWAAEVERLLRMRADEPEEWEQYRKQCLKQGSCFSWENYARRMLGVYNKILNGPQFQRRC
jgi:glycosyltransferase involved in cell wall biosynthesis